MLQSNVGRMLAAFWAQNTKYSDVCEIVHPSLRRPRVLRELKQLRRRRRRHKTIGFMSKTTALHVHQAL